MKRFLTPLFASAAFATSAAYAQKPGDSVTPEALAKLEWIKGEAPAAWEPGKLYVLECWATWCGPCLAAIPHVDSLYDKYASKGLRVIGVDVWEDGKDKVAEFVKAKGDGMSYPVAYTGKGGVFETEWLNPAGVKGIPHTFLVKDGKVLAGIHPMKLTGELVEILLQGGDGAKTALDALNAGQAREAAESAAQMAFLEAAKKSDADGMTAAIADLKKANPESMRIPMFESQVLIVRGDWESLNALLGTLPSGQTRQMMISFISSKIITTANVPLSVLAKLVSVYEAELSQDPLSRILFSQLCWQAGDKDKALAQAKAALEIAKGHPNAKADAFEKFLAAVEGGSMPTSQEFVAWMNEGNARAAAASTSAGKGAVPIGSVVKKK